MLKKLKDAVTGAGRVAGDLARSSVEKTGGVVKRATGGEALELLQTYCDRYTTVLVGMHEQIQEERGANEALREDLLTRMGKAEGRVEDMQRELGAGLEALRVQQERHQRLLADGEAALAQLREARETSSRLLRQYSGLYGVALAVGLLAMAVAIIALVVGLH